jgi:hypothetical protein
MLTRIHATLFLLLLLASNHSDAVLLPKTDELKHLLAEPPIQVEVVEPHLAEGKHQPHVIYLGYPVDKVFRVIFGNQWKSEAAYIEFRALDGYVSRIPTGRFDRYPAYLVFEKKDGREFSVDNRQQHERHITLAPYYLVWDNIHHPGLVKEGGTYWPYQISEIRLTQASERNLALGKTSPRTVELEKYCLSCHQVNGYGGNKTPLDLAERAKMLGKENFLAWVLNPASIKPDTRMPALSAGMPEPERRALAGRLFEYLNSLPRK